MELRKKIVLGMILLLSATVFSNVDISGIVTDSDGKAIEGVSVGLLYEDLSTETDADGRYQLSNPTAISNVVAQKSGFSVTGNRLSFSGGITGDISVELFSVNGQKVSVLYSGSISENVNLHTDDLSNGIYIMAVTVNGSRQVYRQSLIDGSLSGIGSTISSIENSVVSNQRGSRATDFLIFSKDGYYLREISVDSYTAVINATLVSNGETVEEDTEEEDTEEEDTEEEDTEEGITVEKKNRALLAKVTADWCGPCGTYAPLFEQNATTHKDDAISMAVYPDGQCNISTDASKAVKNAFFPIKGYPTFFTNTKDAGWPPTKQAIDSDVAAFIATPVIAGLGAKVTSDGTKISVSAKAEFYEDVTGDYSLAVYVVQKHKDGAQTNYNGGHHYVLEETATASGTGEPLATSVSNGDTFEKEFSIDVNSEWDSNDLLVYTVIWNGKEYVNGKSFTIGEADDVDTGGDAPEITTDLSDLTVKEGETATFFVIASGDNLSYEWSVNGSTVNETAASYSFTAATSNDGDKVSVKVSNSDGSVLSATATLTVTSGGDGTLPTSFTQKVLFEEPTGTWCGYCPQGSKIIKNYDAQYGDKFIAVAIHINDVMEINEGTQLASRIKTPSYPSSVTNRGAATHPVNSRQQVSTALNNTAKCGVSIDATVDGKVTVNAAFLEDISGDVRITAYLLESGVANSGNYKQSDYNGMLWPGFTHDHILSEVLTNNFLGESIVAKAGEVVSKTFNYDLSTTVSGNADNCTIVAFVNVVGATYAGDDILNVQKAEIGEMKDFE